MLVSSISAARSAALGVAKNINFKGSVEVIDKGRRGTIIDTRGLPEAKYNKLDADKFFRNAYYSDGALCIKKGNKFPSLQTSVPVYQVTEKCLTRKTSMEHSMEHTELYFNLPDGEQISLGDDYSGAKYAQACYVLQQARENDPDAKPLVISSETLSEDSPAAKHKAAPVVTKNGGKVQILKDGPVVDAKDLGKATYAKAEPSYREGVYGIMNNKKFAMLYKQVPVYRVDEPRLEQARTGDGYTDLNFIPLSGDRNIYIEEDGKGIAYAKIHDIFEKARNDEDGHKSRLIKRSR